MHKDKWKVFIRVFYHDYVYDKVRKTVIICLKYKANFTSVMEPHITIQDSAAATFLDEFIAVASGYFPILMFLAVAFGLSLVLIGIAFLRGPFRPDLEKNSAYECGFDPFSNARMKFDVRFYLVAILFIIFDLEIAFLFPWSISLGNQGMMGFWSMMVFLGVLTVGFVYEWKKGALEWE